MAVAAEAAEAGAAAAVAAEATVAAVVMDHQKTLLQEDNQENDGANKTLCSRQ